MTLLLPAVIRSSRGRQVEAITPPPPPPSDYSLLGNPDFDIGGLSGVARTEYDTLLAELADTDNVNALNSMIDAGDLFTWSRVFHSHINSILNAFRVTGDLQLLDHVDVHMEGLRGKQRYGWTNASSDPGKWSQYLMWVMSDTTSESDPGEDRKIDDLKIHGLVAMVAYALDLNRGFASPGGRNYTASADQWRDYMLSVGAHAGEGFLSKLNAKYGAGNGFNYAIPHSDAHSWWSWMKCLYFMDRLTGGAGYWGQDANRCANVLWASSISGMPRSSEPPEIHAATIDGETGFVWQSNIARQSTSRNYLQAISYSASNYGDCVTFHFEGWREWASNNNMRAFARPITELQLSDANGVKYATASEVLADGEVAGDVGGNSPTHKESVGGIPANPDSGRPLRRSVGTWADQYQHPSLSAWDDSGFLASVSGAIRDARASSDLTTRSTSGLFIRAFLRGL